MIALINYCYQLSYVENCMYTIVQEKFVFDSKYNMCLEQRRTAIIIVLMWCDSTDNPGQNL